MRQYEAHPTVTVAPLQMTAAVEKNPAKPSMFSYPFGDRRTGARRGLVDVKL